MVSDANNRACIAELSSRPPAKPEQRAAVDIGRCTLWAWTLCGAARTAAEGPVPSGDALGLNPGGFDVPNMHAAFTIYA